MYKAFFTLLLGVGIFIRDAAGVVSAENSCVLNIISASQAFDSGIENLGLLLNVSDDQEVLKRLERENDFTWKKENTWSVLKRMMNPYFQNRVAYHELVSLIMFKGTSRNDLTRAEHRHLIDEWARIHTPDIKWLWPEDLIARLHRPLPQSGILDDDVYFGLVAEGIFPVIDHHNLITHFSLLLDRRLLTVSKQLAHLYLENKKILDLVRDNNFQFSSEMKLKLIHRITRRLENIVRIWHGFQERRFVLLKNPQTAKSELAILGGTPATRLFWAHPKMEASAVVELITDLTYFSRLDYSKLDEPLDDVINLNLYPDREHQALEEAAKTLGISIQNGVLGWDRIRARFTASIPTSNAVEFTETEFLSRMERWEQNLAGDETLARFLTDEYQFDFWIAYANLIQVKTKIDIEWLNANKHSYL